MVQQIAIGAILVTVTAVIHILVMEFGVRSVRKIHAERWNLHHTWTAAILTAGFVLTMFVAAIIEASLYAATYLMTGALQDVERAVYFSLVTYTSLGYGDITLGPDWALLAAIEAANGIIMFGWTTALIFWFVQQVYRVSQQPQKSQP